ncbi:unnamed protein product [Hymenolepis diminuta]|uniref:RH1 domain-containing protein n=1 Tax=Hymenolepis diminuta TaxID=6216 RepID=A0A564YRM8_HYMDI|nr:unnamed protein product [Hymenolepis diminuta]
MNALKMESLLDTPTNYLSPHVRNIASVVYSEFERLLSKYGEGVVDGIVPIMIRTLEQVDQLHESNEILQATNIQNEKELDSLTSRLEREIKARRAAEEKVIALEDEIADVRIQTNKKLADFSKLARILEAKCDAADEHIARQEAREVELRRDLASSQNRCNELCTHVAQMERTLNRMRTGTLERPSPSGISQFTLEGKSVDIEEVHQKRSDQDILEEFRVLQPVTSSFPLVTRTLEDDLFDALDETTEYEQYSNEPTSTRVMSDESDDISKVSDVCEFMGFESLATEVKKLVTENQDLTEMKNALNILKDDLLSRIDDLSGNNIILENDLRDCREQLASECGLARQRERQLTQRIQELTSRLWVAEKLLENARTGVIVRCVSEKRLHDLSSTTTAYTETLRRRTQSSEAILTAVPSSSISIESGGKKLSGYNHQECSSKPTTEKSNCAPCSSNTSNATGGGTLHLTKRQIARIIVERNYYKEHYIEFQDRLRAIEIEARTQPGTPQHLRKRDMAHALFSELFEKVRNIADGMKQDFEELIAPSSESLLSSFPPTSSTTSAALWNILGNFVGQAVTYTADVVIGTGSNLPLDVSRPIIAARVNSKLSNASEMNGPSGSSTLKNHPMYTDHLL